MIAAAPPSFPMDMTEHTDKRRYYVLDAFRGLAALMVALFHFKLDNPVTDSVLVNQAWLFVDFFFVLSGFVLAHTYFYERAVDLRAFTRARLARLYPLYLYALLVMVAFETLKFVLDRMGVSLFNNPPFAENDLPGFIYNITLLNSFGFDHELTWNTPGWSISAEFWSNMLIAALLTLPFLRGRFHLVAGLAALGGMAALIGLDKGLDLTYDAGWWRCLYGFALGMLVYSLHRRFGGAARLMGWMEAPILLACLAVIVFHTHLWFLSPPFAFAAAIYVFACERGLLSRFLKTAPFQILGHISYSIYLNHVIVAIIVEKAARLAFPAMPLWASLAATAVYVAAVLVYAGLTYRWIEVPARKALRR